MPLSHVGVPVGTHYVAMRDFYKGLLEPLGYGLVVDSEEFGYCGFGPEKGEPDFWLGGGRKDGRGLAPYGGKLDERVAPVHVAFQGKSKEDVDQWYESAIKFGATDNGKPGERPHYVKGYYAAFVLDPLGNNIEVVYMVPQGN